MNSSLKVFFGDLQAWIDAGKPDANAHNFSVRDGVCYNLENWYVAHRKSRGSFIFIGNMYQLRNDLRRIFSEHYVQGKCTSGNPATPFNTNFLSFHEEQRSNTLWDNPERLKFVREMAS